jgi:hypothetical protein
MLAAIAKLYKPNPISCKHACLYWEQTLMKQAKAKKKS